MFTQEQVRELLDTLTVPCTEFDCGTLCAPDNDGIPVCCDKRVIVPVLYKTEYKLLRGRSKLWRPYRPQTAQQRELKADTRSCDAVCECKGVAHCERDNRSIVCRTFPFEPYVDHDRQFVGLIYNQEFTGLCPLTSGRHEIRQDFVEQCTAMWEKAFAWSEEELEFYFDHSVTVRRSYGQKRRRIPVITREGRKMMPTKRPARRR